MLNRNYSTIKYASLSPFRFKACSSSSVGLSLTGAGNIIHSLKEEEDGWTVLSVEQVDHQLIGAHHDGGVGDLPDQVGEEAPVKRPVALLPGDCGQSLEEGAILGAFLA